MLVGQSCDIPHERNPITSYRGDRVVVPGSVLRPEDDIYEIARNVAEEVQPRAQRSGRRHVVLSGKKDLCAVHVVKGNSGEPRRTRMYARLAADQTQILDVAHDLGFGTVYAYGSGGEVVEGLEVNMSHGLVRPRTHVIGEASKRVLTDDNLVDYTPY